MAMYLYQYNSTTNRPAIGTVLVSNVLLADGTVGLSANWLAGAHQIQVSVDPSANNDLTRKSWVDTQLGLKLDKALDSGKIWIGTASNVAYAVTPSGQATIATTGVITLDNAAVIAKVLTGYASGSGTITASDSILSAIEKLNGNDALKLPLAGGTMSGNIAMGGNKVTGAADASAAGEYVTYGQLQSVSAVGKLWREAVLTASQLVDGGSGGIYGANVLVLSSNLSTGDTVSLNDGTGAVNYVADTDFAVGGSISATLANLSTAINGGAIAVSATTGLLDSIGGAVNDILVLWQDTIGEPTRIFGNAGAAAVAKILPVAKCYDGFAADLVALPTSDPAATNFGFSRAFASLMSNETHSCRLQDSGYTWNSDANLWVLSGENSVPLATKSLAGKVQVGDGIAVSSGTISAAVDNSSLDLTGSTPNKTIQIKALGVTAAKLNADVIGNGLTGANGSAISVKSITTGSTYLAKVVNVAADGLSVRIDGSTIGVNGSDQLTLLSAPASTISLTNNTGSTVNAGTLVAPSTTVAGELVLADAADLNNAEAVGVVQSNIANGATGLVVVGGEITVLTDGTNFDVGKWVYTSYGANVGKGTKTAPTGVNYQFKIGRATATNKIVIEKQWIG